MFRINTCPSELCRKCMNSEPEASLSRSNALPEELGFKIIDSEAERRDCPESIVFCKSYIAIESILMLSRDRSEAMPSKRFVLKIDQL